MNPTAWLLLAAVLLLDTGSHLLLKGASMRAAAVDGRHFVLALLKEPLMWLAAVTFVLLFFAWLGFLSLVPLGQGVMAGSITIAGVMVGGRIFFNEAITPARATAAGLIAAGVLLVGLGG
jgi:drug/metabolite transporter (DMT)-like permease